MTVMRRPRSGMTLIVPRFLNVLSSSSITLTVPFTLLPTSSTLRVAPFDDDGGCAPALAAASAMHAASNAVRMITTLDSYTREPRVERLNRRASLRYVAPAAIAELAAGADSLPA